MKQLQNNFTISEQSKRLLELGVPADSADCYYRRYHNHLKDERFPDVIVGPDILIGTYDSFSDAVKDAEGTIYETIPCWSVGRLIEIAHICSNSNLSYKEEAEKLNKFKEEHKCETITETIIMCIEDAHSIGSIDFSKLEE